MYDIIGLTRLELEELKGMVVYWIQEEEKGDNDQELIERFKIILDKLRKAKDNAIQS